MFSSIGNLKDYWHVIALASEVKRGKSLKRRLYDRPILIWRDQNNQLHALSDVCAHQKTPLAVKDFRSNQIVCPYHGWEYDQSGALTHVPSSPSACEKLKCSIPSFRVVESSGFIWIYLGDGEPPNAIPDFREFERRGWGKKFRTMNFETTEELLIANFMDPTHTPLVHDGLIRSSGNSMDHQLTVTTEPNGVKVEFEEREESVGPGMRLLFGSSVKVRHWDEFLLPNFVRVTYCFNGEPRFLAFIACTPIGEMGGGQTQAFVQLRYRLGPINFLASPFLSLFANKVLKQDFEITQKQFSNMQSCDYANEHLVAADAVAARVADVRSDAVNRRSRTETKTQQIELRF